MAARSVRCTVAILAGLVLMPIVRLSARQRHKIQEHTVHRKVHAKHVRVKHLRSRHSTPHHYTGQHLTPHHYTGHHLTSHHVTPHHAVRHSHARRRRHHVKYRARRHSARIHIHQGRVEQIQQALVKAGFLNEKPTGRWDSATRHAMRHYQQAHGFTATGLPEAKPLMKLGLGPHPLPPGAQPPMPDDNNLQNVTEASAMANTGPHDGSATQAQ